MVYKVIQPRQSQRTVPSSGPIDHLPFTIQHSTFSIHHVPCSSHRSSSYLFIYLFYACASFQPLCVAFSKSAKLILILIEINEVIFFWRLPLPFSAFPSPPLPVLTSTSLWQMDFNFQLATKGKTFAQNQNFSRTTSLYRFIIVGK